MELEGNFDLYLFLNVFREVVSECRLLDIHKVLIDGRKMLNSFTRTDRFAVGTKLPLIQRKYYIQYAVVFPPGIYLNEKLLENTAMHAGVDIFVSMNIDEAIQWLRVDYWEK